MRFYIDESWLIISLIFSNKEKEQSQWRSMRPWQWFYIWCSLVLSLLNSLTDFSAPSPSLASQLSPLHRAPHLSIWSLEITTYEVMLPTVSLIYILFDSLCNKNLSKTFLLPFAFWLRNFCIMLLMKTKEKQKKSLGCKILSDADPMHDKDHMYNDLECEPHILKILVHT